MDPITGSALIGAGSSLLGGLMGGDKFKPWHLREQLRTNMREIELRPTHMRKGAEEAGFNPLAILGGGGLTGGSASGVTGYQGNTMGSAIADAGMMLADSLLKRQDFQRATAAEEENKRLKEKVTDLTIRPIVGGIYADRVASPTISRNPAVPSIAGNTNLIDGPDGLTQGSETAAEFEKDLWNWGREGSFGENVSEVINRNIMTRQHRQAAQNPFWERDGLLQKGFRRLSSGNFGNTPQRRSEISQRQAYEKAILRQKADMLDMW